MTAPWQPLLEIAGASRDLVSILVGAWREPNRARSVLNHDGVPLQLCLSAGARGVTMRLIGDPHTGARDRSVRATAAVQAAYHLLDAAGAGALRDALDVLVAHTLPEDRAALPDGTLWLAGGVEAGAAIYTTLEWGDVDERWDRVARWLDATLPAGHAASKTIAALHAIAVPVSAAVEGARFEDARVKLYVRLRRDGGRGVGVEGVAAGPDRRHGSSDGPAAKGVVCGDAVLHDALHATGFDDSFARFCALVIGERALPSSGIVLAHGFSLATGALVDRKLDVCGHCVPRTADAWSALCDRVAGELGVVRFDAWGDATEVAVIGMARSLAGAARCNLYVKART